MNHTIPMTGRSQGPYPPDSALINFNHLPFPSPNNCFGISPDQFSRELNFSNILCIGTLNVRSIVHPSKQLNLFSLLLSHQLHGIILTETNLRSPAHKYMYDLFLSQYNYHRWFSFSSSINHHAGVGIFLHSCLAVYVIKKWFYKDRLIFLLLQLPGRQDTLIIGAYIPPSNGSNNKLISECHFTLVSWITTVRSTGAHVLLGGDLNADFDLYLKHISDPTILSPSHSLFQYLHSHLFENLCAFDPSSSPLPTFKSSSSGHLSRLNYLWISSVFPATHL